MRMLALRIVLRSHFRITNYKVPSGTFVSELVSQIQGKSKSEEYPPKAKLDPSITELPPEGLVYTQGVGIEYNVRLSQETWSKLNKYAVKSGYGN